MRSPEYTHGLVVFGDDGDEREVQVSVPVTAAAMARGLQRFPKLRPGHGMLFLPDSFPRVGPVDMWIGDDPGVHYTLAITWLGPDVVEHVHVVRPGNLRTFSYPCVAVIELPVEEARALGVRRGVPVTVEVD